MNLDTWLYCVIADTHSADLVGSHITSSPITRKSLKTTNDRIMAVKIVSIRLYFISRPDCLFIKKTRNITMEIIINIPYIHLNSSIVLKSFGKTYGRHLLFVIRFIVLFVIIIGLKRERNFRLLRVVLWWDDVHTIPIFS